MKQLGTLEFHILNVIGALSEKHTSFSAHDITKELRALVNDGKIEIDGVSFEDVTLPDSSVIRTQKIEHKTVRSLVTTLFDNGTIKNYQRVNSGGFNLYEYVSPVASTPTPIVPDGSPAIPAPVAVAPAASPVPAVTPVSQEPKPPRGLRIAKFQKTLRVKFNGQYVETYTGRTSWKRRSDLSQALQSAGIPLDDQRRMFADGTLKLETVH